MSFPRLIRSACAIALASASVLFAPHAEAIILYGVDNAGTTSDPGAGAPWASVGRLTNSTGSFSEGGAIYLGNGYVLTAHHVSTGSVTHVQFDPSGSFYEIDSDFGYQQVGTNVDLKIFRLENTNPGVQAVNLWTNPTNFGGTSMVIGWGVGRDPSVPLESDSVAWGNSSTQAKRWGLNSVIAAQDDFTGVSPYTNDILVTTSDLPVDLDNPTANELHEASVTIHDSGGGLFQNISGTWYLVGVIEAVTTPNITTFGPSAGDDEVYVRINSNAAAIQSITSVPEPGTIFLVTSGLLTITLIRRRKRVGLAR